MNKILAIILATGLLMLPVRAAETPSAPTPVPTIKDVCEKMDKITEIMKGKNYFHLLNMENADGVVQSIWVGGTSLIVTAQKGDESCLLTVMDGVTYNPDTLKSLVEVYKKQTSEKDV